jgi:hypothetical protein
MHEIVPDPCTYNTFANRYEPWQNVVDGSHGTSSHISAQLARKGVQSSPINLCMILSSWALAMIVHTCRAQFRARILPFAIPGVAVSLNDMVLWVSRFESQPLGQRIVCSSLSTWFVYLLGCHWLVSINREGGQQT